MIQTDVFDTQLTGKDLLTLKDLSSKTIQVLVERAIKLKQEKLAGSDHGKPLAGKILGMIFEKSSTRTRVSFEAGMLQLGGQAIVMNSKDLQIGRGEPISDTAKVLSHYVDGIMIRTFSHSIIEELAEHASIPVINGLTDLYHPCQALADLQTIYEQKGTFAGLKVAYIGDGNNVAHSLMIACAKVGMDISVATPKGYEPDAGVTEAVLGYAAESGAKVVITNDPVEGIVGADVVYADVWTSMGQEAENEIRLKAFEGFQINDTLVANAKSDYIFLHCLPAHREEEVTSSVIDGPNSVVFEQAGNRLHAQKALLVEIMKG
ncbi:ornithine carbamoyltransferase [Bacillus sp. T3]|uniref:ornithine carbamoyltransferase n=1 Tax=Bacillus sp. T3 TaxID=467262 RepID=UPI0029823B3D|nr:ornithine carbamoyltransferase [Bacillus sp. T3]